MYTSPQLKARREADLEKMRQKFVRAAPRRGRPPKEAKRLKPKKAKRPTLGPVAVMIKSMRIGEDAWIQRSTSAVYSAAKKAGRKVTTRTSYRQGVKGLRITRVV